MITIRNSYIRKDSLFVNSISLAGNKKILVSPLDWGLGHAARCIPIIRYLLKKNCEVIIGADGRPLELLAKEFPGLEFVNMPGYDILYPENGSAALAVAISFRKILKKIKEEQVLLRKIVREKLISGIISDNRYGLHHDKIPCVFITHQVTIKSPFAENLLYFENRSRIRKFTRCWIPDSESSVNLSGDLAHYRELPDNCVFIGPLSRFSKNTGIVNRKKKYDLLFLISGPENQRTVFEKFLAKQLVDFCDKEGKRPKVMVVKGKTEDLSPPIIGDNLGIYPFMNSDLLEQTMRESELIICRSGYSTIMDLAAIGGKAVFIPTPGQTEQEYLAKKFKKENIAYFESQKRFKLGKALLESKKYQGFPKTEYEFLLPEAVDEFLSLL